MGGGLSEVTAPREQLVVGAHPLDDPWVQAGSRCFLYCWLWCGWRRSSVAGILVFWSGDPWYNACLSELHEEHGGKYTG